MTGSNEIPGNDPILDELSGLAANHDLLIFAGAGVGAPIWPLWTPLLEALGTTAIERGSATTDDVTAWNRLGDPEVSAQLAYEALGNEVFASELRSFFRRPEPREGRTWTDIQELVVTRMIRGIVTTNYDPGLLDARIRLRPDVLDTGYTNSADADALVRWTSGDIYNEELLPILHLHGYVDRPTTMVLTRDGYRDLYARDIIRQTVRSLWEQQHLLSSDTPCMIRESCISQTLSPLDLPLVGCRRDITLLFR